MVQKYKTVRRESDLRVKGLQEENETFMGINN